MRIDLPEQKRFVHDMRIPIRWGDMDAMGHVNNTLYFRYMEASRIEWMRQAGMNPDPRGQGPVVFNAFCNFLIQLEYPGEVVARLYVANVGRSSFELFSTLERADRPGTVYATGGATMVWVDFPAQKSCPLPDAIRRALTDA